ncbi:MAG: hypothetical protein ABIN00_00385 [candidate division WOR-3 bacterium]
MVKRMLYTMILILSVLTIFSACETKKETLKTTEKVLQLPDKTKVLSDLNKLRNGIASFYMNNGRYPDDLSELNLTLENPLEDFVYNKNNGNVKNKNYPQY